MFRIEAFVPSEVCLACDGCCRFAEHDSPWSPLFLFEEIVALTEKNIVPSCLFTHKAHHTGKAARINLIEGKGQLLCPCLSLSDNKCKIYSERPLDCRLYPFLLVRQDGKAFLTIDEKCPFARKKAGSLELRNYAASLARFLTTPEIARALKKNPEIIQAYPGDFKVLEPLSF